MKTLGSMTAFETILSNERGSANHGWLKSSHTFSFANYYNPQQMGFSDLRVINDDYIAAGRGFGMHPHESMEIFSYVTHGKLEHKDSMGNGEIINAGDVQLMSAGDGVRHSEFNPDPNHDMHLFQIWLYPSEQGGKPTYQQRNFAEHEKRGQLKLIISGDSNKDALYIKQKANIYAGLFDGQEQATFTMNKDRSYFIHVAKGKISINGLPLAAGDALKIFEGDGDLIINQAQDAEILFFDLNKH